MEDSLMERDFPVPGLDLDVTQLGIILGICSVGIVCLMVSMCYRCRQNSTKPPKVLFRSADGTILVNKKYNVLTDPLPGGNDKNSYHSSDKRRQDAYPSYGVTGPNPLNYECQE